MEHTTHTVTIYTETLKAAILDGPLNEDDIATVNEQFGNYLEAMGKYAEKWGFDLEYREEATSPGRCFDFPPEDECVLDEFPSFWDWC